MLTAVSRGVWETVSIVAPPAPPIVVRMVWRRLGRLSAMAVRMTGVVLVLSSVGVMGVGYGTGMTEEVCDGAGDGGDGDGAGGGERVGVHAFA